RRRFRERLRSGARLFRERVGPRAGHRRAQVLERCGRHRSSTDLHAETLDHLSLEGVGQHRYAEATLRTAEGHRERALVGPGRPVELHRLVAVEAEELHGGVILAGVGRRGHARSASGVWRRRIAAAAPPASIHHPVSMPRRTTTEKKTYAEKRARRCRASSSAATTGAAAPDTHQWPMPRAYAA